MPMGQMIPKMMETAHKAYLSNDMTSVGTILKAVNEHLWKFTLLYSPSNINERLDEHELLATTRARIISKIENNSIKTIEELKVENDKYITLIYLILIKNKVMDLFHDEWVIQVGWYNNFIIIILI